MIKTKPTQIQDCYELQLSKILDLIGSFSYLFCHHKLKGVLGEKKFYDE